MQEQYEKIRRYFKTTTEPYDCLEWDGEQLELLLKGVAVERYSYQELQKIIPDFKPSL